MALSNILRALALSPIAQYGYRFSVAYEKEDASSEEQLVWQVRTPSARVVSFSTIDEFREYVQMVIRERK